MANANQFGEGDKLVLYGLFKQANLGDCPAGLLSAQRGNPADSAKVQAWMSNRRKPTSQAKQEFITALSRVSKRARPRARTFLHIPSGRNPEEDFFCGGIVSRAARSVP